MNITIKYLVIGEANHRELMLTPEEYFDPLDDNESGWTIESVPRHQDVCKYTKFAAEQLKWTLVEVLDGSKFWRVRTQFLDGLCSIMSHSLKSDGSEEIIHQTELCSGCWHTIRTLKEPGKTWAMVLNNVTTVGLNCLLADREYCRGWSFEQMKAFGDVV